MTMTEPTKPKPLFSIQLEPLIGSTLIELAHGAQCISDKLNVMAEYNFNGVRCVAYPGGSPEKLERQAMSALKRMSDFSGIKNQVAIS